jgi:signal transduction histidine kinase
MSLGRALAVCALYVVAGKIGLSLAFVHASASAVWPPTGIALAAFLLVGPRVWPAILVGAFLVNVTTAGSLATSLAIAVGNTLEGLLGAYLVNRGARGRHFVDRAQDFIRFSVVAALLATVVSATIGVAALALAGYAPWRAFGSIWLTWWLGDAVGALIVTPVLVLWATAPRVWPDRRQALEAGLLAIVLIGATLVVFGGGLFGLPARNYPITFVTIPPLMWAAFRFGRRAAATATLALSGIAVWGTLHGFGPFVLPTQHESLLLLQAFMGTIAVTTVTVALVVAERTQAREDAEAATRAKDEFLAILSHELRTPLSAVVGWTSMLRTGSLDAATTAKALEVIGRNANLQAQLIEDLLDMSRIVLGQVKLREDVVPLGAMITAAVDSVRPAAEAKGVRLETHITTEVTIMGDATRVQQIVSNLLSNALKFTPEGEQVRVSLVRAGAVARIEVTDTGTGIAPTFLPHLFERFRQADGSRRAYGGLGIGLAIVRHLVELHGGSVRGESQGEGTGATFVVELPATDKGG